MTVATHLSAAAMQCGEHPAGSQRSWRAECNGVVIVDDRRENKDWGLRWNNVVVQRDVARIVRSKCGNVVKNPGQHA